MKIGFNGARPDAGLKEHLVRLGHSLQESDGASDPARLAGSCDIIFLGSSTADDVREEIFGPAGLAKGLLPGKILVDRSDADAESARAISRAVAARGAAMVEAPVSGHYRADALAPVTFLAGPADARAAVKPLLTGTVIDCGDAGKGHALNLFNATMGLATHLATCEIAAMGAKFGLGTDVMAEVVTAGSGRNRATTIAMPKLSSGAPATDMPLGRALNIVRLATHKGQCDGVPMVLASMASSLLQSAVNRYGAGQTTEKAIDLIESMSGVSLRGHPLTAKIGPEGDAADLRVGYVGVGTMGGALARRLLLSRPLMVYDVNRVFVDGMVADGAVAASSAAALARECDVIMICVPTSAIVRQVVFGPGGLAEGLTPGKIVLDQTTGNPAETRAIADDLKAIGVEMMDAPVSGGSRGAVAGTIAIMCGGDKVAFARCHPILAQISPNIVYCGSVGTGHAAKLVQNAVAACNRILTLECAAAAIRSGLTLTEMIAPLEAGSGWNGGASRILPALRTDTATTDFAMALAAKDLRLAMDIGNELGVPMLIGNAARGLIQTCANEEGMKANLDSIARTIEKMSGLVFIDHP